MIASDTEAAFASLHLHHKYLLSADPAAPLVFLVHGRAGTYDVMWTFRRTLPENCSIIAPQAPRKDRLGGFSWWDVENGQRNADAAIQAAPLLLDFLVKAPVHYGLRPRLCIALGFSQGAGMLSFIIQQQPQLLSGVALLAGFVIPAPSAQISRALPQILMLHGSADEVVPAATAKQGAEHLRKLGFDVQFHEDPVGHKVGSAGMRILSQWASGLLSTS